jgi:hypothetical protein
VSSTLTIHSISRPRRLLATTSLSHGEKPGSIPGAATIHHHLENAFNHLHIPILTELGKDLSSRHQAAILRRRICDHVDQTNTAVELDFTGVRTLCESTADELIAVLAVARGDAWFRQYVRISNLKKWHLDVLCVVYEERKKRGVHALVV